MKANGVAGGTSSGSSSNGVKKETKDGDDVKKPKGRVSKKRKLEAVDDEEGDVDEPIKEETKIKGEVKHEDAIVKPEYPNDEPSSTTPLPHPSSQSTSPPPASSSTETTQPTDDDDDDVLFLSSTDIRSTQDSSACCDDHCLSQAYPHTNSPSPSPMQAMMPSTMQLVDYAANMGFPQQQLSPRLASLPKTPTTMMRTPNSFPYGLVPTTWTFPHDTHGYL